MMTAVAAPEVPPRLASVLVLLAIVAVPAGILLVGGETGVICGVAFGLWLAACAVAASPQPIGDAERAHLRLQAAWASTRGDAEPAVPWERVMAWAEPAGGRVALQRIALVADSDRPSPYRCATITHLDAEDVEAAAAAMEDLRARCAADEQAARDAHVATLAAAERAAHEQRIAAVDRDAADYRAGLESKAAARDAAERAVERETQADAVARALRRR